MAEQVIPPQFPPAERAREDGLLATGGRLTPQWLLTAYSQGIFPWPFVDEDREILAWYTPDPRTVIELDDFHTSRRLARRMRSGEFQVTVNCAFDKVIAACGAARVPDDQTWITPSMIQAYCRLHELGHAHSVEVWFEGALVGGVYGVALGAFFGGESMFHLRRDASKVALAYLVRRLRERAFRLFDVQQPSPHLMSLGATEIPRKIFLRRLKEAVDADVCFDD